MKLYYKSGACSLASHIVLRESNLDFTLEQVDLATKKTESNKDYLQINPKGQVPALILNDGSLLTENVVIIQYLADQVPDRNLIPPADTMSRYHLLEWLNFIATELHKGFGPLFASDTTDEYKKATLKKVEQKFHTLESVLSAHTYLAGEQFTIADAYLFTVMRWAHWLKVDFSTCPAINAWFARISARPTVVAAMQAEGLK